MLRSLKHVMDIYLRSRTHCRSLGKGNAVTARISNLQPDTLNISIQSKLSDSDVVGGQIIDLSDEWVNPRGGKRVIDLELPYKTCILLHSVLDDALKEAHQRQKCQMILGELDSSIDNIMLEDTSGIH